MIEHGIQSILSSPVLPKLIEGKPEVPPKHSECHVHIYWFLIERIPRSLLRGYHLMTSLRNLGFLKFRIPLIKPEGQSSTGLPVGECLRR